MSAPVPLIIVEGPFDRQVISAVLRRAGFDEKSFKVLAGSESGQGDSVRDGADYGKAAARGNFVRLDRLGLASKLALVIDLDADTAEQAVEGVMAERKRMAAESPLGAADEARIRDAVLTAGVLEPADFCAKWNLKTQSLDDHLLMLATDASSYAELAKAERKLEHSHSLVMEKMAKVNSLLAEQGIHVTDAKRQLELFRGISGWSVGPGACGQRLVEKATDDAFERAFGSMVDGFRKQLG